MSVTYEGRWYYFDQSRSQFKKTVDSLAWGAFLGLRVSPIASSIMMGNGGPYSFERAAFPSRRWNF